MITTGSVAQVSHCGSMFIVHVDDGEFALFRHLGATVIPVGYRVCGYLDYRGPDVLLHQGHGEVFEVSALTGPCSLEECQRVMAKR